MGNWGDGVEADEGGEIRRVGFSTAPQWFFVDRIFFLTACLSCDDRFMTD